MKIVVCVKETDGELSPFDQSAVECALELSEDVTVISMGRPSDKFEYQIEGVLLHEIQHLIQNIEGFAQGGNPKAIGMRRYLRLAGEVEARNICLRHFLTDDERRRTLRTETQDIEDKDQIIIC